MNYDFNEFVKLFESIETQTSKAFGFTQKVDLPAPDPRIKELVPGYMWLVANDQALQKLIRLTMDKNEYKGNRIHGVEQRGGEASFPRVVTMEIEKSYQSPTILHVTWVSLKQIDDVKKDW